MSLALIMVACGDDDTGGSTTTTASPTTTATATAAATTTTTAPATTTTTAPAPTTTAGSTTIPAGTAIAVGDDGTVVIDWDGLEGIFFAPPATSSADPFFHVHNQPATDGFFLSIEAYTVYGTAWMGELGTYQIDCSPAGSGICIHFDPDGEGPIGDLGADFLATGTIDISQADAGGFVATLRDVAFSDGTTIPGPLTITG